MKTVKVSIHAVNDDEVAVAVIQFQRKRGDTWLAENSVTILSDQPENERSILLDDDQRLVIEGQSNIVQVYDKEHLAMRLEKDPDFPKRFRPTPPDDDGEEKDTPDLVRGAQVGPERKRLEEQEKRDAAISQARQTAASNKEAKK